MQGIIRSVVRGAYDIQKLRIQMGLRIVANFKAKLGQAPSKSEDTLDEKSKELLSDLRKLGPKLLTDAVVGDADLEASPEDGPEEVETKKKAKAGRLVMDLLETRYLIITEKKKTFPTKDKFTGDAVISNFTELSLIAQYTELRKSEAQHFRRLEGVLSDVPVYNKFLTDIPGIGPAMAGVIISEIDISRAKYPSSIWKYAGLAVEADGKGTSKRTEHLKDIKYIDKDGKEATRKGIEYNPFLKTKLMGVLSGSFLRAGDNKYSQIYRNYKNRLENHPNWKDKTKGHRHNASLRYMIKRFLVDLHIAWRTIEGLEVTTEYSVGKLGMKHTGE